MLALELLQQFMGQLGLAQCGHRHPPLGQIALRPSGLGRFGRRFPVDQDGDVRPGQTLEFEYAAGDGPTDHEDPAAQCTDELRHRQGQDAFAPAVDATAGPIGARGLAGQVVVPRATAVVVGPAVDPAPVLVEERQRGDPPFEAQLGAMPVEGPAEIPGRIGA